MSGQPFQMNGWIAAAIIVGGVMMVGATALALLRRQRPAGSFLWVAVAAAGYALLALAAALYGRQPDGLQAALLQVLAVVLAAALGAASFVGQPGDGSSLPAAGRLVAWLALLGFPPTIGFHGRILVYRALLAIDWNWLLVLAMAVSAASLAPALGTIRTAKRTSARGLHAAIIALLLAAVFLLGICPQWALDVVGCAGNAAGTR